MKLPRQLYQFDLVAFFAHPAVQVDSASAAIPGKDGSFVRSRDSTQGMHGAHPAVPIGQGASRLPQILLTPA